MENLKLPSNGSNDNSEYIEMVYATDERFNTFDPLTMDGVEQLIRRAPTKSCQSDPIPTAILNEHLMTVTPILTTIINTSLLNGVFCRELKEALLKPLLKKCNFGVDI